jgi:hypothetical protein
MTVPFPYMTGVLLFPLWPGATSGGDWTFGLDAVAAVLDGLPDRRSVPAAARDAADRIEALGPNRAQLSSATWVSAASGPADIRSAAVRSALGQRPRAGHPLAWRPAFHRWLRLDSRNPGHVAMRRPARAFK